MYYSLGFLFKIQSCGYLTKKYTSITCEKNPNDRILRMKSKEQYLSTVPKSYPSQNNALINTRGKGQRRGYHWMLFLRFPS